MADLPLLKLVEVLGVVLAGGLVVWWQLRDVKRAQEATRRERLDREAQEGQETLDSSAPPVTLRADRAQPDMPTFAAEKGPQRAQSTEAPESSLHRASKDAPR